MSSTTFKRGEVVFSQKQNKYYVVLSESDSGAKKAIIVMRLQNIDFPASANFPFIQMRGAKYYLMFTHINTLGIATLSKVADDENKTVTVPQETLYKANRNLGRLIGL